MIFSQDSHASRPLVTEDAGIVGAGACQLEAWTEHDRNDVSVTWLNPACNFFENTEIALGVAHERSEGERNTLTRWHVKHVFKELDENSAGYGLIVYSERDRRIHRHLLGDTGLTGIVSFPLMGEALIAHTNLGVARTNNSDTWKNRGVWAGALDWEFLPATRLSAETFGISGSRANWQLGIRHELVPRRMQVDASIGSPFGRWSGDRVASIGVIFFTPAFLR